MILKGRKVTLRAVEESDLELLWYMINDPEIEKMTVGSNFPVSKYEQRKWFEAHGKSTNEMIRLIIETEKDGAVGMITLGDFDWANRVAHRMDIKIIAAKVTDSGIALDATNILLKYAFDELNLNRVEAYTLDSNKKSLALQEMLGYKHEGVLRQAAYKGGEYHDIIVSSMLKEEFKAGARKRRKKEKMEK